jgi:hypothetical protein
MERYSNSTGNPSVAGNVTLHAQCYTTNGLANGRTATNYYQLVYELSLADPAFNLKSARANLFLSNMEADHQRKSQKGSEA